ncbi:hypothetical protein [Brevibacillus sp. SYSU BS000544]|uniref:hypothetical protein n=1 Tax=Brevibacillus sp. SYSU BS000544 TaxID=3416443 RepID=UPI003CE4979C
MLVKDAGQLVEQCFNHASQLIGQEEMKDRFIEYVFGHYQNQVVEQIGMEAFYVHLEKISLSNCRKDFDIAVEAWFQEKMAQQNEQEYHNFLFQLAKEALTTYQSQSKEQLIEDLTLLLTSSDGFMTRWKAEGNRTTSMYFRFLFRSGIRSYQDIEAFVEAWLMEYPLAFDSYYLREPKRGRPNNPELLKLINLIHEIKPNLTKEDRERIRKIYYYHRKNLTPQAMVEKFRKYMNLKKLLQGQRNLLADS